MTLEMIHPPLLNRLQVMFPAVPARKSAVEEVVAFLARNLEANETELFSRENGLATFAADYDSSRFHRSAPALLARFHRKSRFLELPHTDRLAEEGFPPAQRRSTFRGRNYQLWL